MKLKLLVLSLAAVAVIGMTANVMADSPSSSFIAVNTTSVGNGFLTIGTGNGSSLILINSSVTVIELTGVHVYPISCDFGLLRPGDIRATDEAFELYNAGNVTVNVTIAVSGDWVGVGHNWTHSDDCLPGVDTVGLIAIVQTGGGGRSTVIVTKIEPYNYLALNLSVGERRRFALEIYAPTTFTEHSRKGNTIFLTVEEE